LRLSERVLIALPVNPSKFEGAMPVRAILFDKDGTLVDIQATLGPATCAVLRRLGGEAMAARLAELTQVDMAAQRLKPGCPVISEATDVYGRAWARVLGRDYTPEFEREIDALYLETTLEHLHPIAEPRAVLGALHERGYRLGIMTNDADANTRAQMERLGLAGLIEFVAGYDSGFGQKPDAAPVLAFASHMGVTPAEVAVVGDSPHDLIAARAAGAVAVGMLSGTNGAAALSPYADVLLPSIVKLGDWLCSAAPRG
jgi:phosphoglycolate phosphatase